MKATFEDAFNLLCGELIGEGIHRKVYACRLRPDLVVKVERHEHRDRRFSNVVEYFLWTRYENDKRINVWLAPCVDMSPDGRIMLQKRAEPLRDGDTLPERLPHFMTDIKRDNFGLLDNQFVCIDYAYHVVTASTRLRKVKWK